MSSTAPAASRARPAARRPSPAARGAWSGLVGVLVAADPAPVWRGRSPWHRRAAYGGLLAATLVACLASLASLDDLIDQIDVGQQVSMKFPAAVSYVAPARSGLVHRGLRAVVSHGAPLSRLQLFAPSWLVPGGAMALAVLLAVAVVVPLPLAARYPLLGWRLSWLALLLVPLVKTSSLGVRVSWWGGWPWDPVQILVLVVLFCVAGVRHQRPVLWWMWALSLVPWWLQVGKDGPSVLAGALGTVAFTAAAIAVDSLGSRRRAQQALADQAERTELEQARRAVLEERARIARELHDVVAHHMSLIAVRAETAPYRLAGLPDPVREEFGSLSGAAREALADMRRLLGVLRHDQPAERAPQPQLADLPVLVETARQAGVPVELSAAPALDQVPAGVGVCAYRIVQESLSNAGRHAPGAAVTVSVGHGAGAVVLRVANGPGGPAGPAVNGHGPGQGLAVNGHGPGQGLAGMQERVALLGGSLSAGPAPDGGFVVSAVLPLSEAA
jgi:signal transduction histidine kinase